ncbi:phenylglyoxylate dehydrogenase [Sedimentibacter sp.]|uniref:phenylglyoxylate dehydrogenase n=1 Tax=Sedimentibacter sp. TaxID=1960295 RepID=UPI0028A0F01B|nr:phenylglyoxylate dehydrogenase [Sedimentibacter sp.]
MASTLKALTGNKSAALGAALCKPDLIAAYPITPQSSVVEILSAMANDGELDSDIVQVESEHSAMSIIQGASMSGGRTFTATSGNGLALMFEPYCRQSTLRLPTVMAIATREMQSPHTVFSGLQDAMSIRDGGWMMMFCENNQEILDMIIQGYRISENQDVLLPINVCYDGFYLSHLSERVEIPDQDMVTDFVKTFNLTHLAFDPENPMAVDPMTSGPRAMKYREDHLKSMQNAIKVINNVDKEFEDMFGRSYGGVVDTYLCDDAETVLVTMGATTGTVREAVDVARADGKKVGLLKVRFMRPFPVDRIAKVLSGKKGFAVVDRSVSFGWNTGMLYTEVQSAVSGATDIPHFSAIGGLGGADITLKHVLDCIERLENISDSSTEKLKTIWLD